MRARVERHLGPEIFDVGAAGLEHGALLTAAERLPRDLLPPEFNWRDYVAMLLDVAAEIEHSLMVQYLFAAYSLGGSQVPADLRETVRDWQETILDVAKEEMGHLVTVQNVRTALGLPLHLGREEYPWDSGFYPFGFTLEPLTLETAAMYVCAESPADWSGEEADEIKQCAAQGAHGVVNRVGALYSLITRIVKDRSAFPDSAFDASTVPRQASWDEWGRGYSKEAKDEPGNRSDVPNPDLLILEASSRDTLIEAVEEIGEQGEGPFEGEDSHFERFRAIYKQLKGMKPEERKLVARPIRPNPKADDMAAEPIACAWAHLFNVRYRMLLVNISHAFQLAESIGDSSTLNPRGALINRTFAEMYNLRAISGTLVERRVPGARPEEDWNAAPPFQMPYTLVLPPGERNRWRLHRDLLQASDRLIGTLLSKRGDGVEEREASYLEALADADAIALAQAERMLGAEAGETAAEAVR
ncbi:MAG: ferritin-like domain-containing protein [Solirubrobacterales bacterium]